MAKNYIEGTTTIYNKNVTLSELVDKINTINNTLSTINSNISTLNSNLSALTTSVNNLKNKKLICAIGENQTKNKYYNDSYISFTKLFDQSEGKIVFGNDGLITVDHVGMVEIGFNLWFWGEPAPRIWIELYDYDTQTRLTAFIADDYERYSSVTVPGFINYQNKKKKYGIRIRHINSNYVEINTGSDITGSFVTVKCY